MDNVTCIATYKSRREKDGIDLPSYQREHYYIMLMGEQLRLRDFIKERGELFWDEEEGEYFFRVWTRLLTRYGFKSKNIRTSLKRMRKKGLFIKVKSYKTRGGIRDFYFDPVLWRMKIVD